jgi:hypothetical protein
MIQDLDPLQWRSLLLALLVIALAIGVSAAVASRSLHRRAVRRDIVIAPIRRPWGVVDRARVPRLPRRAGICPASPSLPTLRGHSWTSSSLR